MSQPIPAAPAALYRRHRPGRFADMVGQPAATGALLGSLSAGKVSHAYLFSGPRGTGKTSAARILAKALNCTDLADGSVEPCGTCASCRGIDASSSMDVIELDAASNTGVDAMRDLISRVALGTAGNRKVYIIDEVHMLSNGASSALLKTLEEPAAHVVFVLATTDPQKVLPTIKSRTQHLPFKLVRPDVMSEHLHHVIASEGLDVPSELVVEAVRRGAGSVRDALSALDVLIATGSVVDEDRPTVLVDALLAGDRLAVLSAVASAVADGIEPRVLAERSVDLLRDMFLHQQGAAQLTGHPDLAVLAEVAQRAGARRTVSLMEEAFGPALLAAQRLHDPRIALEVNLARWLRAEEARASASS